MYTIEHAQRDDFPKILDLQRLCYEENAKRYNDYNIPPLRQTLEEIAKESEESVILKASEEGLIIGSIRAYEENRCAHIGRVIVHPDFQNRGIGKALMGAVEELFSHVRRFELFTGAKDEKNLHFYASLGYSVIRNEEHGAVTFVFLQKINK